MGKRAGPSGSGSSVPLLPSGTPIIISRRSTKRIVYLVLGSLIGLAVVVFSVSRVRSLIFPKKPSAKALLWSLFPLQTGNETSAARQQQLVGMEPTYRVELQLTKSSKKLYKRNSPMDVCRMMTNCFSQSRSFGHLDTCQPGLERTMEYYDSVFLIENRGGDQEDDRVVGFLSLLPIRRHNHVFILIYNVCVDPERRRKGLARKLLTGFIDKYVAETAWPRDRIFLGLDVDMRAPMAYEALSLYIKLGYVRWMEPCSNVHDHDPIRAVNPPISASSKSTLQAMFSDPTGYAARIYKMYSEPEHAGKDPGKPATYPTHFCMYRRLNESFDSIGKALVAEVARLDKVTPNPPAFDDE